VLSLIRKQRQPSKHIRGRKVALQDTVRTTSHRLLEKPQDNATLWTRHIMWRRDRETDGHTTAAFRVTQKLVQFLCL